MGDPSRENASPIGGRVPGRGPGPAHGLEPGAALTVPEAATLAGVGVATIEGQMADGSLLFETQKKGGKEVRIIRVMDLADVYLALRPPSVPDPVVETQTAPRSPAEPGGEPTDEPTEGAVEGGSARLGESATPSPGSERSTREAPTEVPAEVAIPTATEGDAMVEAVRASGADRNALIELCQDLETRLDLAERERQASTASLLMAQRRVLDLERIEGRRPITWAVGASLGVCGIALAVLAFRLPGTVRSAVSEESQRIQADYDQRATQMRASLDDSMAALTRTMTQALDEARAEERELLVAERAAQEAQILALETRLAEARALQKQEADAAAKRAVEAADAAQLQSAEDRRAQNAALETRLQAAEALGETARTALAQERSASESEREAFRQELADTLERHDAALQAALARLEQSAQAARAVEATEPLPEPKKTPTPWWKRALGDFRD